MPRHDYFCPACNAKVPNLAVNKHGYTCPKCKTLMERIASAPNFTIKGQFTAKNGYSGG